MSWFTLFDTIVRTVGSLFMGSSPSVDLGPIYASHERQMKELRDDMLRASAQDREMFQKALDQKEEEFKNLINSFEEERNKHQEEINSIRTLMEKPVKRRKEHIAEMNMYFRKPEKRDKVLLLGVKGCGKSTVMYLNGEGEKPSQSASDGTVKIIESENYVDVIGLSGWDIHSVCKILVLVFDRGVFPKDIAIFTGQRIFDPKLTLSQFGIIHPMILCLSADNFWSKFSDRIVKGKVVRGSLKYKIIPAAECKSPKDKIELDEDSICELHSSVSEDFIEENSLGLVVRYNTILKRIQSPGNYDPMKQCYDWLLSGDSVFTEEMDGIREIFFRYCLLWKKMKNIGRLETDFMRSDPNDVGPKLFD